MRVKNPIAKASRIRRMKARGQQVSPDQEAWLRAYDKRRAELEVIYSGADTSATSPTPSGPSSSVASAPVFVPLPGDTADAAAAPPPLAEPSRDSPAAAGAQATATSPAKPAGPSPEILAEAEAWAGLYCQALNAAGDEVRARGGTAVPPWFVDKVVLRATAKLIVTFMPDLLEGVIGQSVVVVGAGLVNFGQAYRYRDADARAAAAEAELARMPASSPPTSPAAVKREMHVVASDEPPKPRRGPPPLVEGSAPYAPARGDASGPGALL